MLCKICKFGAVLPHAICDMYKIIQLFWPHIMHVNNFLRTWCLVNELQSIEIN
jgi:hypothetical protein